MPRGLSYPLTYTFVRKIVKGLNQLSQLSEMLVDVLLWVFEYLTQPLGYSPGSMLAAFHVLPGSATTFGRGLPTTSQAQGIMLRWVKWEDLFQADLMLPQIDEIILIEEPSLRRRCKSLRSICAGWSWNQAPPGLAMPYSLP